MRWIFMKQMVINSLDFGLYEFTTKHLLKNKAVALMYHGTADDSWISSKGDWLQVKRSEFKKQMEYVKKNFKVIPLFDLMKEIKIPQKKPLLIITMDDGYANNYSVAYPILKDLEIPATIFIVTDTIDKDHIFWWDKLYTLLSPDCYRGKINEVILFFKKNVHPSHIDKVVDAYLEEIEITSIPEDRVDMYRTLRSDEIEQMSKDSLISFGSHTDKHEILINLTQEELDTTLRNSLEKILNLKNGIPWICFPNGWFNDLVINRTIVAGYHGSTIVDGRLCSKMTDPFKISRIGIGNVVNLSKFKYIVSGIKQHIK